MLNSWIEFCKVIQMDGLVCNRCHIFFKSCRGVVDKSLVLYPGVPSSIPGSPSRLGETCSFGSSSVTF